MKENFLDRIKVKICNKIYSVRFSPDVSDDATIELDDCEILINERLYSTNLISQLERFFHEVAHGYESYFELERLFNVDSKEKEDVLENAVQIASKSFITFMFDNVYLMEEIVKAIKKEKKRG